MTTLARSLLRAPGLAAWVALEVVKATGQVAWDAVTPRSRLRPGIVAYTPAARTPAEVTLFSNLVTLVPGTLTIEIDGDPPTMYIHGMYAGDAEAFRAELRAAEARLLRVWRGDKEDDS